VHYECGIGNMNMRATHLRAISHFTAPGDNQTKESTCVRVSPVGNGESFPIKPVQLWHAFDGCVEHRAIE
uniref:hypothetical protein n=1 Tax=uncultured Bifidobacterium sp. TaxID=165187 RepID=UPI00261E0B3C